MIKFQVWKVSYQRLPRYEWLKNFVIKLLNVTFFFTLSPAPLPDPGLHGFEVEGHAMLYVPSMEGFLPMVAEI